MNVAEGVQDLPRDLRHHLLRVGGLLRQVGQDVSARQGVELEEGHLGRLERVDKGDLKRKGYRVLLFE